jgi:integrase
MSPSRRRLRLTKSSRHASPTTDIAVRMVWAGIRREKGSAKKRKTPTLTKLIRKMIATIPDNLLGTRDRALLLLGYAGGFRRAELVGLHVSDLELADEGSLAYRPPYYRGIESREFGKKSRV